MPIDVGLRRPDGTHEFRLQLMDDGTYWFLHPWFLRVRKTMGQYIDLYGDAEFHEGKGLGVLVQAMAEARAAAQAQPVAWQVHVGTQLKPVRKELHAQVRRAEVLKTLEGLLAVLEEARATGHTLVLTGD